MENLNKKFKFEKFLAVESTMYLDIKVAELNTLSDGKGITGIHSAVFLMRRYNYKVETFLFNIF